jgi:hypothetical protein
VCFCGVALAGDIGLPHCESLNSPQVVLSVRFFLSSDAISFFDSYDVFFEAFSWFLLWVLCLVGVEKSRLEGIKIGLLRLHSKIYILGGRGSVLSRKARIWNVPFTRTHFCIY